MICDFQARDLGVKHVPINTLLSGHEVDDNKNSCGIKYVRHKHSKHKSGILPKGISLRQKHFI